MSKIKTKNKFCQSFDGFGGLKVNSPVGSGAMVAFNNFKLLPDGSAEKRKGFRHIYSVDGEYRGGIAYADGGEEIILCAVGKNLVRISVADSEASSCEIFSSEEGAVKFIDFLGELYILDGCELYRYLGSCNAEVCTPYIPVYGMGWAHGLNRIGTVNQPLNMLTPRIKIIYSIKDSVVSYFNVGKKIKSVDAVWHAKNQLPATQYKIGSDGMSIQFNSYYFDGNVEVYLTLDGEEYRNSDFEGCDRTDVFDAFEDSRIFVYGGEDSGRAYCSVPVDEAEVSTQTLHCGRVAPVYFPSVSPVRLNGINRITAMKRIYDRMLIFSEYRTWITTSLRTEEGRQRQGIIADTAIDTIGCPSFGAVSVTDGIYPVTLSHGGVYKWNVDPEFEEEISVSLISRDVNTLFDSEFVKNGAVCFNRGENELWFANKSSLDGCVMVYNCGSKAWYMYSGIPIEDFIELGEKVAFRSGNSFYVFDGDEGYDIYEWSEKEIEAVIESAGFDFSAPAVKKHIDRIYLTCDTDGGNILLEVWDTAELLCCILDESQASKLQSGVDFFDIHTRTSSSRCVSFRLYAEGRERTRIYGISFFAS